MSERGQAMAGEAGTFEHSRAQERAAKLAALVAEVAVGLWLLLLFLVAVAWDPFDRRLGFRARRYGDRAGTPTDEPDVPAAGGAYAIGPAGADDEARR